MRRFVCTPKDLSHYFNKVCLSAKNQGITLEKRCIDIGNLSMSYFTEFDVIPDNCTKSSYEDLVREPHPDKAHYVVHHMMYQMVEARDKGHKFPVFSKEKSPVKVLLSVFEAETSTCLYKGA